MPQPTPPLPPAPVTPSTAPGQVTGSPVSSVPTAPISPEQAAFLRSRRTALSNQLESAQGRRDEVAEQLRSDKTQAAERPGLQERLRVLDERLVQIERDISANSEQLANAPGRGNGYIGVDPRGGRPMSGFNPSGWSIIGIVVAVQVVIQIVKRTVAPNRGPSARQQLTETAAMNQRVDRLESALDAVAIEVERIGEGQRFLTSAMTANLPPVQAAPVYDAVRVGETERR